MTGQKSTSQSSGNALLMASHIRDDARSGESGGLPVLFNEQSRFVIIDQQPGIYFVEYKQIQPGFKGYDLTRLRGCYL